MKRDEIFLSHILDSARKIGKAVRDMKTGILPDDDNLTAILSWHLTVIGEATNNLSKGFKEKYKHEIPFREIIGMRNFVVHEYFSVERKSVWDACTEDVPKLKRVLIKILKDEKNKRGKN